MFNRTFVKCRSLTPRKYLYQVLAMNCGYLHFIDMSYPESSNVLTTQRVLSSADEWFAGHVSPVPRESRVSWKVYDSWVAALTRTLSCIIVERKSHYVRCGRRNENGEIARKERSRKEKGGEEGRDTRDLPPPLPIAMSSLSPSLSPARCRRLHPLPPPPPPQLAPRAPSPSLVNLTSNLTFVDVGLDDLYVLVDAFVAHLLLVKLDIHAHNSTSSCGTWFVTRLLFHRAPVTFT